MFLVDILQLAFSVQCEDCFASSFSPITAAWATQGYWMQATIIEYMDGSGLATIAALLYVLAVGAGIVGYALGSPPRNYLWYFLGPALFHFLLFTTEPAKGVAWQMGIDGNGAPIFGNQTEVWKLSEVGLVNQENVLRRGVQVSRGDEPTQLAEVSTVFLTVDALFSDFIQGLVGLLGTKEMMANRAAGANTNIPDVDTFENFAAADFYRISNSKWGMLENITYASVKDIKMTKSLAVFFGSDCGGALVKQIDQGKFTAATRARSGQLPESIFKTKPGNPTQDYKLLKEALASQGTSISPALKQMFPVVTNCNGAGNSLTCFSDLTYAASEYLNDDRNEWISCDNFLSYLIEGMRWESGNAYYQLINSAPEAMEPKYVLFNLFYGWGIRKLTNGVPTGRPLNAHDELIKYTPNLILVHILRNMFEFTNVTPDQKFTPADDMINLTQTQQRNISSKTKFIEVYSWALMIPYIQGLVLYFLSIAYPVVCIAMIMPNLYKLPLTWIKFWFWAKSWDLGFAIVMAIDKSVWAMMSNSPKSQTTLGYIAELSEAKYHPIKIDVTCANKIGSTPGRGCADAIITDPDGMGADPFIDYLMPIFDKAMILSKNLELDLANSYYIYIMAALYFAVPAVTGQLVGSIGSLAGGALDKMTDVKGVANAGVTSDKNQRLAAYSQIAGQERSFATQRNPGGYGAEFGGDALQRSVNQSTGAGAPAGGPLGKGNAQGNAGGAGAGANGSGGNRVAGGGGMAASVANFGTAVAAGVSGGAVGGRQVGINRAGMQQGGAMPGGVSAGEQGAGDVQAQSAFNGANIGQQIGGALMPGGAIPGRIAGAAIGAMMGGASTGTANRNQVSPTASGNSASNGADQRVTPSQVASAANQSPVPGASANKSQGGMSGNGATRPASSSQGSIALPFAANSGSAPATAPSSNSSSATPSASNTRSANGTSATARGANITSAIAPISGGGIATGSSVGSAPNNSGASSGATSAGFSSGSSSQGATVSSGATRRQSVSSGTTGSSMSNGSTGSAVNFGSTGGTVSYGSTGGSSIQISGGSGSIGSATGSVTTSSRGSVASSSQATSRIVSQPSSLSGGAPVTSASSPLAQFAASGGSLGLNTANRGSSLSSITPGPLQQRDSAAINTTNGVAAANLAKIRTMS